MKHFSLEKNSKATIKQGSKSFSLASQFFSKELRNDVAHLYSWCRWCDDVTDGSTLGFNQNPKGLPKNRVEILLKKSQLSLEGKFDYLELPFIAFGKVMRKYQVPWIYAEDLLKGMDQDVSGQNFQTFEDLRLYCYRVAGTVGLIMCHLMGLKNCQSLGRAVDLGIALQLTNIARDIGDDFRVSKIYLPNDWLSQFNIPANDILNSQYSSELESLAKKLLRKADEHYQLGLAGLRDLPWRCALAVAIAASVYRTIGRRVIGRGHLAWQNSGQARSSLRTKDQFQACCLGISLFLKTVPSRIFNPRRTLPIDQIWRYV